MIRRTTLAALAALALAPAVRAQQDGQAPPPEARPAARTDAAALAGALADAQDETPAAQQDVPQAAQPDDVAQAASTPGTPDADWSEVSAYGCSKLPEARELSLMEGADGTFFRTAIDFRMYHPLSEDSAELVGRLSDALSAAGTDLVYVPVPTKSLAMPHAVPDGAARYGFDADIAAQVYDQLLERLRDAGVRTVNLRRPLAALDADSPAFIGTDFHWSSHGARAAAAATAEIIAETPGAKAMPGGELVTQSLGQVTLPSPMRRTIQRHCLQTVPPARTEGFATSPEDRRVRGGIFANRTRPAVVLVGTSMSALRPINYSGFLGDALQASVANYAITGGNQFGSITSYLLSDDFRTAPPHVLVWENPIYNNLGEFGARPLVEMIAAVQDDCRPLDSQITADGTLRASPPASGLSPETAIRVDTGGVPARTATVTLTDGAGVSRTATIRRTERLEPTPRFYQEVRPITSGETTLIEAKLDRAPGAQAGLALCNLKETQG